MMNRERVIFYIGTLVAACLAACAVNPVTGERELALISEEQEVAMGRDAARQAEAQLGFVEVADLQSYVERVGLGLARDSERPELPWEFHVIDDPTPNAFALPGGFIFVTRGLVELLNSEAELAAVLGHEIGHVTARHSVNQLSRAQLAQLGVGLGMVVLPELQDFGQLANTGLSLFLLKHGRDDERQADELGFNYMLDDRYDVREMANVFEALQASGELAGVSPIPNWLASHPSEPDRIEAVRARIDALGPLAPDLEVGAETYLAELDGLVYGADPREGYFEGGMFYHPELAFQFRVPEAWQKQNLKRAVFATSPNRDAALELTLVSGDAREAAGRFFAQQAIQPIDSDRTSINGNDAVVSRFQAETANGGVAGVVAHIAGPGGTYQLVTYAPTPAFNAYAETFGEIVASFGPVTDRDVLRVQPRRLEIIELDRDTTLAEFERRYPSEISIEELAVLNQVDGAESLLRRGTSVKRVVG